MLDRLSIEERVVGASAVIAIASAYLTWFSYDRAGDSISLNGFRASILGDIFVLATGTVLLFLAAHLRLLRLPRSLDYRRITKIASLVALAAVGAQILFSLDQGQHMHLASAIALIAGAAMFLGSRRQVTRSGGNF